MRRLALVILFLVTACESETNSIIPPNDIVGDTLPKSLTGYAGDPENGVKVFTARASGHCVLCHQVTGLVAEFQGNVGPDLTHVGDRLTIGQLRLRLVDYQIVKPGTVMPSYYRTHDLYNVSQDYIGDPVLSAEDIEDLIAYLSALKE